MRLHREPSHGTSSLAASSLLTLVASVWQGLSRFLTNWLIGRLGGASLLGLSASLMASGQLLTLLWPSSSGTALSRYVASARALGLDSGTGIAKYLVRQGLVVASCLTSLAILGYVILYDESLMPALVAGALTLGYGSYAIARGLHYGAGRVRRMALLEVILGTLALAAVLYLLATGTRDVRVLLPLGLANAIMLLVSWPRGAGEPPARSLRKDAIRYIALGSLGTLASAGFLQGSLILASLFGGTSAGGLYAAALSLVTPAYLLATSLNLSLLPHMTGALRRGDWPLFDRQFSVSSNFMVAALGALLPSVALLGPPLVTVVWGDDFAGTASHLPWLASAVLLTGVAVPSVNALGSRGAQGMRTTTRIAITGSLLGLTTVVLAGNAFGSQGVAAGYMLGATTTAALMIVQAGRTYQLDGTMWLLLRVAVLVAVSLIGPFILNLLEVPTTLRLIFVAIFLALWLRHNRATLLAIFRRLSGKRSPSSEAAPHQAAGRRPRRGRKPLT